MDYEVIAWAISYPVLVAVVFFLCVDLVFRYIVVFCDVCLYVYEAIFGRRVERRCVDLGPYGRGPSGARPGDVLRAGERWSTRDFDDELEWRNERH